MKLIPLVNKKSVQEFLEKSAANSGVEFLESLEWADILKSEDLKVESLGLYNDKEDLVAVVNLIKNIIWRKFYYYYSPRGPIFNANLSLDTQTEIWQFLTNYLKEQGAIFWRVEPKESLPANILNQISRSLQPKETLMLDLNLSEEVLLSSFQPKTRYNIRLADKKGVSVREASGPDDFENFWKLKTETGERDFFKIHDKKHYQTLATANPDLIKLFLAEVDGKIVAAGLFSFYGDKVTYLHGASDHNYRQFMAPYLLQWTLIKLAKEGAYKYYDFYGIDEHKWPGVTRFKLGFSGFRVFYAGTYDLILNQRKYNLYNLIRRARKFL